MPQTEIFLTARRCVGCRFRHQGRRPDYGLDCIGLIIHVARTLGLSDFDRTDYKKIPGRRAISRYAGMAGYPERRVADMMPGDIVIMRFGQAMEHAAIMSDRGVIHACEKYGKVVEHRLDDEWRARIIAVYSFPAVSKDKELS